jgi:RES domain
MQADLFAANIDFHDDLVRNIPGIRESQNLFDDLSPDSTDWNIAIAAEGADRIPTAAALITRPFDYGTVISYTFDASHWHATRFSDGSSYGLWYGSLEIETTVFETAWHWYQFVLDSFGSEDREIVSERRLFDVRCDALLIDLRRKEITYPDLVSRTSYAFTHQVGRYLHEQDLNGLLTRSARCDGTNGVVFKADRLSNVRDRMFLTYRLNVVRDTFVAERTPRRKWLQLTPSTLGPPASGSTER